MNSLLQTPRPSITMPGTNSNKSAYYESDNQGASGGLGGAQEQKTGQDKKGGTKDSVKQGSANQG